MATTATNDIVTTIGVDLGKNVFHLIGMNACGAVIFRERLSRAKLPRRRCHANQVWPARRLEVPTQVQAAVAARHVWKASSRKTRSVRRDVRWRWTLKVFWTTA